MGTELTNLTLELPDGGIKNVDINSAAAIDRTKLAQQTTQIFDIPLIDARVWDDVRSILPATAANDDLGIITGTWGTDAPTIQSGDGKATTITRRAVFAFRLPPNYVASGTVQVRIRGGMVTTVSDTSATVDVEAYKADLDGAVGSDLCQTGNVSINSLTKANATFTIDGSGLSGGDFLYLRVTVAITDGATGTAVIGELSDIRAQLTTQG